MPFQVQCCKGDDPCTPQECLDHAATRQNKCDFTYELLASLFATVQERDYISTTTLMSGKCLRSEFLKRTEGYVEEPKARWKSWRGTMFHGQLEKFAGPGAIPEARFHAELTDLGPLSGSPDLYTLSGILYDYKNTGSIPRFGTPWKDHVEQLNVNRWLVDHAHTVEITGKAPEGLPLDLPDGATWREGDQLFLDLTNDYIRPLFVPYEWQSLVIIYMDENGPAPMTVTKSIQVPKKDGNGTKAARVPDIWSDEYATEFIREQYEKASKALTEGNLPEIPPGYEHQAHPLCGYCPVRARCRELELEGLLGQAA